jgi:H2-forming N5,N10-methylenetetrahydromethanopterin dehydrogenase-like enzyme
MHEADRLLAEIEDQIFELTQTMLSLLDKHGIEATRAALEEAIEIKKAEME